MGAGYVKLHREARVLIRSPVSDALATRDRTTKGPSHRENLADHLPQRGAVFVGESPELAQHQASLDGGDDVTSPRFSYHPL